MPWEGAESRIICRTKSFPPGFCQSQSPHAHLASIFDGLENKFVSQLIERGGLVRGAQRMHYMREHEPIQVLSNRKHCPPPPQGWGQTCPWARAHPPSEVNTAIHMDSGRCFGDEGKTEAENVKCCDENDKCDVGEGDCDLEDRTKAPFRRIHECAKGSVCREGPNPSKSPFSFFTPNKDYCAKEPGNINFNASFSLPPSPLSTYPLRGGPGAVWILNRLQVRPRLYS